MRKSWKKKRNRKRRKKMNKEEREQISRRAWDFTLPFAKRMVSINMRLAEMYEKEEYPSEEWFSELMTSSRADLVSLADIMGDGSNDILNGHEVLEQTPFVYLGHLIRKLDKYMDDEDRKIVDELTKYMIHFTKIYDPNVDI